MATPREVAEDYLSIMDVEALYLVGSVALGDYRPGVSDIDFVAVTEKTDVRGAHAALSKRHPRPYFDGIYVTWADLAGDPRDTTGTHVHEHTVETDSRNERHPVTWHTLAQCGVTIHGPDDFDIWTDEAALKESVRENLDTYWRKWLNKGKVATLTDWGPPWVVLGVTRLHYTLATGKITSKTGAGEYAREIFPEHSQIIDECLRLRRGEPSLYRSRPARRRDTLAYLEHVISLA